MQDPKTAFSGQVINEHNAQAQIEQARRDIKSKELQELQGEGPIYVQSNDSNQQHEQETVRTRSWRTRSYKNNKWDNDAPIVPSLSREMFKELEGEGGNDHTPIVSQKGGTVPESEIQRDSIL